MSAFGHYRWKSGRTADMAKTTRLTRTDNCYPPVALKLLKFRLLGAKAHGLAIAESSCTKTR
jgi:hypothetical protein